MTLVGGVHSTACGKRKLVSQRCAAVVAAREWLTVALYLLSILVCVCVCVCVCVLPAPTCTCVRGI